MQQGRKGFHRGANSKTAHSDTDERLRSLQREMDRAARNSDPEMNSAVLHAAPQRHSTSSLRLELDVEIDRLLYEQVRRPNTCCKHHVEAQSTPLSQELPLR